MKVSKKRLAKYEAAKSGVWVLARIPNDLHRKIKSEAALQGVKIGEVVTEAVHYWCQSAN